MLTDIFRKILCNRQEQIPPEVLVLMHT